MVYAVSDDIATELGRPITTAEEISQVNWWISGAELKLRNRLGDLAALDSASVNYVVVQAVARRARNPEGKQQERIDDYSYNLNPSAASAELIITDEEWALLTPTTERGAFSIRAAGRPGYAQHHWGW
jgi:hypothetical protein